MLAYVYDLRQIEARREGPAVYADGYSFIDAEFKALTPIMRIGRISWMMRSERENDEAE